ncbi:nuclear transport factor 2 family protein [Stenotrophomonas maltophilia]|uniref:nuclear transport factor 2 family protein n=1 Tax=Stenotrophomonas sp. RAC2 TaxID=3064902 RepID=UPI001310180D|nr:nuclear transport factor 2 family protein [Stenotrophomonas sp. RAC2]MBH1433268.1 nuclear transport factor 2 family protein [Stenotrophomonas maltophilia]MDV9042596.1 nuclear transport factor 2 family protein [Stenotrophomonas sp. RAC2]
MSHTGRPADAALAAELVVLERALHAPAVRADHARLAALLDEDFSEIGSSGRCYGREAALAGMPLERAQVVIESDQYAVSLLGPDLAQVRYRSRHHLDGQPQGWVLRSSLWRRYTGGWRMVFHQGTPEAR